MNKIYLAVFTCLFFSSWGFTKNAMNEIRDINTEIEGGDTQPHHVHRIEGLLNGTQSRIVKTYATKDDRLEAIRALFNEHDLNQGFSFKTTQTAFQTLKESYELSHLTAFFLMKHGVIHLLTEGLDCENYHSWIGTLHRSKNAFLNEMQDVFGTHFDFVKRTFDSYTEQNLRTLFPETMTTLKNWAGFKPFNQQDYQDKKDALLDINRLLEFDANSQFFEDNDAHLIQSDRDLARILQEQENFAPLDPPIQLIEYWMEKEDREIFCSISDAYANIKNDADVHGMTQSFARPHYPEIKRLEQTYIGATSKDTKIFTLDEITANIRDLITDHPKKGTIEKMLAMIAAYWPSPVDGETGQSTQELFTYVYKLAEKFDFYYLNILCEILAENLETNGGCHPGVNGRFVSLYFHMVRHALYQIT